MSEEKPHPASARKLRKAAQDGRVYRSTILAASVGQITGIFATFWVFQLSWVRNRMLLEYLWAEAWFQPWLCIAAVGKAVIEIVGLCLIFAATSSIIADSFQVGLKFQSALLLPKTTVFQIGGGARRIIAGLRGSWQYLVRLAVLGFVFFRFFFSVERGVSPELPLELELGVFTQQWFESLAWLSTGLLASGLLDFLVQRANFGREMRMGHEELRREVREEEGDPHVRMARRVLARNLSYGELVERTRKARVIVVERE